MSELNYLRRSCVAAGNDELIPLLSSILAQGEKNGPSPTVYSHQRV